MKVFVVLSNRWEPAFEAVFSNKRKALAFIRRMNKKEKNDFGRDFVEYEVDSDDGRG